MRAYGKTKDKDLGKKRIEKEIAKMKKSFVTVGVHDDKEYKGGTSVALVAAVNEFGTTRAGKDHNIVIPERSFLRSTFDEKINLMKSKISSLALAIIQGKTTTQTALRQVGADFRDMIRGKIETGDFEKNEEKYLKRKLKSGAGKPLIHTRKLLRSIDYEVKVK